MTRVRDLEDMLFVNIKLKREQAIALFEWAQRFAERQDSRLTHPADAIAIESIASELERELPIVFAKEYSAELFRCRARVLANHLEEMGKASAARLLELDYQDYPGTPE